MLSKNGLIYLSRTHILIYTKDTLLPLRLDFEEDTIKNLEEVNKDWITLKIKELLGKTKLKGLNTVMILSKDIVFDKLLEAEDPQSKESEIKDFLLKVPFSPLLVKDKEFVKDDNVLIAATNKDLYESIVDILRNEDIIVNYVLPEVVFNKVEFNKEFLKDLFKQKDLLKYGNFLDENQQRKKINFKAIFLTLFIIIILGALVGLGVYVLTNREKNEPVETQTIVEEVKPEVKEEKTLIEKKNIDVTIRNGTGTPGFAGQVAKTLGGLGYENVNTGNADSFDYTKTIINRSSNIPDSQIEEITKALGSYLEIFEIKEITTTKNEIEIITGTVLSQ